MPYRYILLGVNILLLTGLLCVYYKPYVVMLLKNRLQDSIYQQKLLAVSDVSNVKQILNVLISIAKVQIYKNSILITKVNYDEKVNKIDITINSQDLDNLSNYINALKVEISKQNAYIGDISTIDNSQQELLMVYASKNTLDTKQKQGDVDDPFAGDFSYTTNLKINL